MVAAVLAAVLLPAALAGCTSGTEPGPNYSSVSASPSASDTAPHSPTASPSPSVPTTGPNVSPGESPPTPIPTVSSDSSDGALAFATYYIKMLDWVYATSQPAIVRTFYADGCTNCLTFLSNLESQVAGGHTYRGSRLSIDRQAIVTNDGRMSATFAVSTELTASPLQIVDGAGSISNQGPQTTITLTNWLKWLGTGWTIVDQGKA